MQTINTIDEVFQYDVSVDLRVRVKQVWLLLRNY